MRVWFIRHGETEHNIRGVFQGQLDTPLTTRGVLQASETAAALGDVSFDRILASDLRRAYDTALALADGREIGVEPDRRLREMHYGVLQDVAYGDFRAVLADHGVAERWGDGVFSRTGEAPPGGESLGDLVARVMEFRSEILDADQSSRDVALVTHGGTIRTFMTVLIGLPHERRSAFSLSNCGVSCFSRAGEGWQLQFHNRVYWQGETNSPLETI